MRVFEVKFPIDTQKEKADSFNTLIKPRLLDNSSITCITTAFSTPVFITNYRPRIIAIGLISKLNINHIPHFPHLSANFK